MLMLKTRGAERLPGRKKGIRAEEEKPAQGDLQRLRIILHSGFGVANGYSSVSRDRYHVNLRDGKTEGELFDFCLFYLHGEPMPGSDPLAGRKLLEMFRAAESAGLVKVEFASAGPFIPELGRHLRE